MPIVEGYKSITWGRELAKLLGYKPKDLQAWIEHYKQVNAKELDAAERKRRRLQRKVQRWRHQLDSLTRRRPSP